MKNQTTTMKKYRSIDQAKLKVLCDDLCDNIESLLDTFGLDYKTNSKMISMSCPIHGGDNPSAVNIYPEGETYRGNWKCRTHNCEQEFKSSIIGFVRGIISNQKYGWLEPGDPSCSFNESLDYVQAFLNKDISSIKISKVEKEKKNFTNIINYIHSKTESSSNKIKRPQIIKSIQIPANYYINRNYAKETLIKYQEEAYLKNAKNVGVITIHLPDVLPTKRNGFIRNGNIVPILKAKIIYITFGLLKIIFMKLAWQL